MYDKILALLQEKYPQARKDGLSQLARSLAIQAVDETESQALVEKIQETQVTDFIKDWRKDVDSEVSRGTKSFEDNLRGKYDFTEKKTPTKPNVQTDVNPTDIASIIAAALKPLQDQITGFETGRTSETRKDVLLGKLTNAPEVFKNNILKNFGRMNFATEEEFTEYLGETEADVKTMEQETANNGLSNFPRPTGASTPAAEKEVGADIAQWAASGKKE